MKILYAEILEVLTRLEKESVSSNAENVLSDTCDLHNHITELKEMLRWESTDYHVSK